MLNLVIDLLLTIHVVVSLLIILVVLMQRPKNEGLGAAFGGGMTDNLFGAQTTNVLQKFTRWLGGLFFLLTLVLSMLYAKQAVSQSEIHKQLMNAPKPAPTAEHTVTPLVPPKPEPGAAFTPSPLSVQPIATATPDVTGTPDMTLQPTATPAATSSPSPSAPAKPPAAASGGGSKKYGNPN